jgi:hypothetical protein
VPKNADTANRPKNDACHGCGGATKSQTQIANNVMLRMRGYPQMFGASGFGVGRFYILWVDPSFRISGFPDIDAII